MTRVSGGTTPGAHLESGTLALVLAGGNGTRLADLSRWQAKPAVVFGGTFRNVDFSLSNRVNSGIRRIAVLTQRDLMRLLQSEALDCATDLSASHVYDTVQEHVA